MRPTYGRHSRPPFAPQPAAPHRVSRGFRASWQPLRLRLERTGEIGPGLTLYGLRHTVAVILRDCGFDERTVADALGQKTIEMARHYARGADLRPKMHGVVAAFDKSVNERRTKAVKPAGKTVKP